MIVSNPSRVVLLSSTMATLIISTPKIPGNIQHPTSNIQQPMTLRMEPIGCSMLDVGCWMFSASWLQTSRIAGHHRPQRQLELHGRPFPRAALDVARAAELLHPLLHAREAVAAGGGAVAGRKAAAVVGE